MPTCYNADEYFKGPSFTLTQVLLLLLPKQPSLRDGRENTCPPQLPPKIRRRLKKKGSLILCYKINKGLDQHQVTPLRLMVSLHFTVVQSCLVPFSANTAHQKTTVLLHRSEDCSLISQKWLHITKGQNKQTAEVWTDN